MKTNNKIIRNTSLVIALIMVMSSFSFAYAEGKVTKDETVYVNLNSEGKPIEKTSSIRLYSDKSLGKVTDKTSLKNVMNVKGDEEPEKNGDSIVWETDNSDIFYQGTTDKELPLEVKISYYLDGKKVEPKSIIGESGEIKIDVSIKNKESHTIKLENGKEKNVYTPFSSIVVMNLPIDKFKNVKTNSGKVVSDGNNQVVTYISLPGLKESLNLSKNIVDIPEYLTVTADVKDFEMGSIVVTATSSLPEVDDFESAGDFDELIDGIDKIVEASQKLSEATGKLLEGQLNLSDGIEQFSTGLNKVNTGAHSLSEGAKSLKDGVSASYEGSKEINNGVNKLSQSAFQLGEGYVNLGNGIEKFSSSAEEFSKGAVQVSKGISTIPEKTGQMSEGMNNIVSSTEQIVAGQEKLTQGISKSTKAIEEIKKGKEKELKVVELLLKGLDGLDGAVKGLGKVPGASGIAEKMAEGLAKQRMALEGLIESSNQLIVGLTQVEEGLKEAEEASSQLSSNLGKVNQGQKNVAGGIGQLAEGTSSIAEASNKLVEGSQGLSAGATELKEGSSKANEGTTQFVEGSKALSEGSEKLTNGLGQLNAGAGELYNGSLELSQGTEQLEKGAVELKEGSKKLADGTSEFDENMRKFHNEGIMEMKNKVNESDLDIDSVMETKDKLVDLSKDYSSFTGISDNMDGSVKFVMKTEEVKGEEEKESLEVETKVKEKSGFIAWLKGLFKKNK